MIWKTLEKKCLNVPVTPSPSHETEAKREKRNPPEIFSACAQTKGKHVTTCSSQRPGAIGTPLLRDRIAHRGMVNKAHTPIARARLLRRFIATIKKALHDFQES
jgi:hypothetical protein